MNKSKMPLCIITGVGPENGTGAEIAKYFSEKNYKVAMIARNKENLRKLENKYDNSQAYPCDVGNLKTFTKTLNLINNDHGDADVVIHNAPSATRGSILKLDPEDLEKNFRINTTALLYLAKQTLPGMLKKKRGTIIVTGNTASTRGKSHWGFFCIYKGITKDFSRIDSKRVRPKRYSCCLFYHRCSD